MSKARNIDSIEMMRGIAAFMVAYFHLARGNKSFLSHDSFFFSLGAYGWAGVEIFFIISGFIITYAMYNGGYKLSRVHKFLAKRLVRLEPPYIVSIIVVIALMYISTLMPTYRGKPVNLDWMNVLSHLGYVNAFTGDRWLQDVYWSLAIEFEFYLGLALLFPLIAHKHKAISWAALIGLLLMTFVSDSLAHVFKYIPFFAMGIALSMYRIGKFTAAEFWTFLGMVIMMFIYKLGWFYLGLSLITIACIHFINWVPKPLKWLGGISYSLYLLHIPIGGRIINLSENLIKNPNARIAVLFAAIIICCVLAHFFYKVVEKPFQKLSKKISY